MGHRRHGYTLFDMAAVVAGVFPGMLVGCLFQAPWRGPVTFGSSLAFGVGLWCLVFLGLPRLARYRRGPR